jgi:hypothetical protein
VPMQASQLSAHDPELVVARRIECNVTAPFATCTAACMRPNILAPLWTRQWVALKPALGVTAVVWFSNMFTKDVAKVKHLRHTL